MEQHETPTQALFPPQAPRLHAALLHDAEGLMREITIDQAIAHFKDIEGRYRALYTMTRLPESIRRRIKDNAAQAHMLATLAEKEKRKIDRGY